MIARAAESRQGAVSETGPPPLKAGAKTIPAAAFGVDCPLSPGSD